MCGLTASLPMQTRRWGTMRTVDIVLRSLPISGSGTCRWPTQRAFARPVAFQIHAGGFSFWQGSGHLQRACGRTWHVWPSAGWPPRQRTSLLRSRDAPSQHMPALGELICFLSSLADVLLVRCQPKLQMVFLSSASSVALVASGGGLRRSRASSAWAAARPPEVWRFLVIVRSTLTSAHR